MENRFFLENAMKKFLIIGVAAFFLASHATAQKAWQFEDKEGNRVVTDYAPPKTYKSTTVGERTKRRLQKGSKDKNRSADAAERTLKTRCVQARERLVSLLNSRAQDVVPPEIHEEIDTLELFVTNNCQNQPTAQK